MSNSFNRVYGRPDEPFYYGLKQSKDLKAFLDNTNPPRGEAFDLGCGEGRNNLLLKQIRKVSLTTLEVWKSQKK